MAKKKLITIKVRLFQISLMLSLSLFLFHGIALGDDVTVITDIAAWNHPVKDVFRKYKVKVHKVELYKNKTYPIFYVKFPYDPMLGHNNNYFSPLYYEILKANGFWDYSFIDLDSNSKINIGWDKRSKTLTEEQIDAKSLPKEGVSQGESEALPPPPPLPD